MPSSLCATSGHFINVFFQNHISLALKKQKIATNTNSHHCQVFRNFSPVMIFLSVTMDIMQDRLIATIKSIYSIKYTFTF